MGDDRTRPLHIIRFTLLISPILVAGALWTAVEPGSVAPDVFEGSEFYVTAVLVVVFGGFFGGLLTLRARWQAAEAFDTRTTINLIGWALAEGATLLGLAYLFLMGNALFFGAGLGLQGLASFVLLPVPEP